MDKEKKNAKLLLSIIIVLLIITIGICIFLIIRKNNDKKTLEQNNTSSETTKKTYDIVKGNEYQIFTYFDGKYELFTTINLDYPKINSSDNSVSNLNNQIKSKFDQAKSLYETKYQKSDDNFCKFCYLKDAEYYCNEEINDTNYLLQEDDNYLLIRINNYTAPACSSGYNDLKYYTYDKKNNKLLSNNDIINTLKYDNSDIQNKLKTYIENNYQSTPSVNINKTLDNLNSSIYFIFNNHLYIVYKVEDELSYHETVMYNGNNIEKVNEDELNKKLSK